MGKEILHKTWPRKKAGKGSTYDGVNFYGRLTLDDFNITIGKEYEVEVIVREYDKDIVYTEEK